MSYEQLMYIGFGTGIVFLTVSIVIFFALRVPAAIGELSGRTARKKIAEMKEGGKKSRKKGQKRRTLSLGRFLTHSTEELGQSGELEYNRYSMEPAGGRKARIVLDSGFMEPDRANSYVENEEKRPRKGAFGFLNKENPSRKTRKEEKRRDKWDENVLIESAFAIPGRERKASAEMGSLAPQRRQAVDKDENSLLERRDANVEFDEPKKRGFFFREKKDRENNLVKNNEQIQEYACETPINQIQGTVIRQDGSLPGEGVTITLSDSSIEEYLPNETSLLGNPQPSYSVGGESTYLQPSMLNHNHNMVQGASLFEITDCYVIVHTDEEII